MTPLTRDQINELYSLYHLARTPLSGTGKDTPYNRRVWASKEFNKLNPEISSTRACSASSEALKSPRRRLAPCRSTTRRGEGTSRAKSLSRRTSQDCSWASLR